MYDNDFDEDEFYDDLFEELFPEDIAEPSFAEQVWQGDASGMLHSLCD